MQPATILAYQQDSYARSLTSTVLACEQLATTPVDSKKKCKAPPAATPAPTYLITLADTGTSLTASISFLLVHQFFVFYSPVC
jgi:hypothetical protein